MIKLVEDSAGDPPIELAVGGIKDVYEREYVPMVRVAYLMVGSESVAEELVHDAFAQLIERWDCVERPGAYLRQAVVNNCRSRLRRRSVERKHLPALAPQATVAAIEREPLLAELGRLPARQRAAVVMRFYLDATEAEIADALDVRPGTVKSLIHSGLANLRKDLES